MIVHALILAGGRGSRLGDVRKAGLRIGGRTLLARVAERMSGMPLLISTGPRPEATLAEGIALADQASAHNGPMAGIEAALRHLRDSAHEDDLLLTVAVDTPFLPADYRARMIAALDAGAPAAYAAWGSDIYPTNAIYRLSALHALAPANLPDSPKRLLQNLGAVPVDWSAACEDNPFANLNILADLVTLGRRARQTSQ
jgi:Molybdopterin-guanine dinucleotide biosynthesis protein A